jgi:hypothetical protein
MTKVEYGVCPACGRELPLSAFYSDTSTYCIECEKIYRKERYAEARDIKLDLISEYDNLISNNLKIMNLLLSDTKDLTDRRAELSKRYSPTAIKKFIEEADQL